MTKKIKVYLLLILAAVCLACTLVGCKIGRPGLEEVLAGYKAHVIYYSNGGFFDDSTTITVREMYFRDDPDKDGVPFFDVGKKSSGMKVDKRGYDIVGWCLPARYTEGEHAGEIKYYYEYKENEDDDAEIKRVAAYPRYEEDGETPITDNEADRPTFYSDEIEGVILEKDIGLECSDEYITSDYTVGDNETLIVCADWAPTLKIEYILKCEEGKTYKDGSGKSYKNGDILSETEFGDGLEQTISAMAPVNLVGATFARTYGDEACETAVETVTRPEEGGDGKVENTKVYSYYLDGDWSIVTRSTDTVRSMFNNLTTSKKYYIVDDVDCSGLTLMLSNGTDETAQVTIKGHGTRTLSNLYFKNNSAMQGAELSMFGSLGENFNISGVIFKDVKIEVSTMNNIMLFAFCSGADASAVIDDVTIDGVTANVSQPSNAYVNNAQSDRNYWLFGGKGSDQAFLDAYGGITLTEAERTLTIEEPEGIV